MKTTFATKKTPFKNGDRVQIVAICSDAEWIGWTATVIYQKRPVFGSPWLVTIKCDNNRVVTVLDCDIVRV